MEGLLLADIKDTREGARERGKERKRRDGNRIDRWRG
jgi:hypothetical protein